MNGLVKKSEIVKKGFGRLNMPEITIASTGEKCDVVPVSVNKTSMRITVRPLKTDDIECEIVNPLLTNGN